MSKPTAVLISDCHYSLSTYKIADIAFRSAIDKAAELGIPLIDAGDITNDKAIMRAEVCNTLIDTMEYANLKGVKVTCVVGNHSLINEKSTENALEFLRPWCDVVKYPVTYWGLHLIPYQTDPAKFYEAIDRLPKGSIVIGHQGTKGGTMGDYIKDHSAIDPELVKDYKVFLGHYHKHYTLGTTVSIGNPYTLTFGEANDGPKGFLVLYDDGSFTREILPLRRHVKLEYTIGQLNAAISQDDCAVKPGDLLWLKVIGPRAELDKIKKEDVAKAFCIQSFKLDKVYEDSPILEQKPDNLTSEQLFDQIIDTAAPATSEHLKKLWRDVCE